MIKRIIFDIDDTLIENKPSFALTYKNLFNDKSEKKAQELYDILEYYETKENIYDENKMLTLINTKLNTNYDITFIKKLNEEISQKWINKDNSIIDTIKYLSQKYELYALTNWFTKTQEKRLENSELLKYFKKVIGTDKVKIKPNREPFEEASENQKIEECLFIGDNPKKDLDTPYKMGAQVILLDKRGKYKVTYKKITQIKELKDIL